MTKSTVLLGALAFVCVSIPEPARAWNYDEHADIGRRSLRAACTAVASKRVSVESQKVFELFCGSKPNGIDALVAKKLLGAGHECMDKPNDPCSGTIVLLGRQKSDSFWKCMAKAMNASASVECVSESIGSPPDNSSAAAYGEACALSGDHLGDPNEFHELLVGRKAASLVRYGSLALENYAHFYPVAPRNWRTFHGQAIKVALESFSLRGAERIAAIERALFINAFADHFLQDSFVAGHMGFNRAATSAAASKEFHDYWNKNGRPVANAAGRNWVAHGDGYWALACGSIIEHVKQGCDEVLLAGAASVTDIFVAAFTGKTDEDAVATVWRTFPTTIFAPTIPSSFGATTSGLVRGSHSPTSYSHAASIFLPAKVNFTFDVDVGGHIHRGVLYESLALGASFDLGLKVVPVYGEGMVGAARNPLTGSAAFLYRLSYNVALGFLANGLINNYLAIQGELVGITERAITVGVVYHLNVEIGKDTVRLGGGPLVPIGWGGGPSRDNLLWGIYLGYGKTLSGWGGGSMTQGPGLL